MAAHIGTNDFAQGAPNTMSALSQSNLQNQNSQLEETAVFAPDGGPTAMQRTPSSMSQSHTLTPSRGGTLKKKQSLSRRNSTKRAGSKRGSRPGSVRSLTFVDDVADGQANSAFYTPVPTHGSPTEVLANRFQVWRNVLKDLITYFRDLQKSYEAKSKSLYTLSNVVSNINAPSGFMESGGISDAISVLREYHKKSISEGNTAKSIEQDVIVQLTGLRSDLGNKIKEIKGLSGDFKNTVDKETEGTRRAVKDLEDALQDKAPDAKGDPFMVRIGVERQLGKQIEEENYLHNAFLNLESSGRELESIVMGEIQKAYAAYAGILKREADEAYEAVENLSTGPLALQKDSEWNAFVHQNDNFVNPRIPVRKLHSIAYPGKDDPAAAEVRGGMLERKSKYLKSYTPGWYVLSPTHLHEFKSPDHISSQTPVMSLPLADQKLGSHSEATSTSHKFMLKGRQSGGMHKSHAWVFRAESYDTMMAWFSDIKALTEKTGIERDAFIRRTHARSVSGNSQKAGSISDGSALDEDEADQVPYSAAASHAGPSTEKLPQRPQPGGRFPSLLSIHRDSHVAAAPSSPSENSRDRDAIAAAEALPGSSLLFGNSGQQVPVGNDGATVGPVLTDTHSPVTLKQPVFSTHDGSEYDKAAVQAYGLSSDSAGSVAYAQTPQHIQRHDSTYGEWMAPAGNPGYTSNLVERAQRQEDQAGLQVVEILATSPVPQPDVTMSAPAATQLSYATFPTATALKGPADTDGTHGATVLLSDVPSAEQHTDTTSPFRGLSDDLTTLDSRTSVASSSFHVPGGYPPSRVSTQKLQE